MRSTYPNFTVYVIDNGSTDGSQNFVRTKFPAVRLLAFQTNLGFVEAYNHAVAQVDAEYVLFLNNDTSILTRNWIELLVEHLEMNSDVAAVGCKLVTMKNPRVLDSVGVMGIKYWRGFVDIGKYETDRDQYDNPPITPFSACGAAMLVRKNAFDLVGGFDSKFFAYVEDVDLSWRLRLRSFKLVYEPAAKVAHYYSGSRETNGLDTEKLYLSHRNVLRAILKNCGSSLSWALRNYFLYTLLLTLGFVPLEPRKTAALVKGILWNLRNFRSTFASRLKVQGTRGVQEEEILQEMFPKLRRYQPEEHTQLRKLLDILFESGSGNLLADDSFTHLSALIPRSTHAREVIG
jgi:GT2 family glycosyltransferase